MQITLTDTEIALATEIAQKRNQSQREAGRPDGLVKGSSIDRDIEGALSELAVSKALGLPWSGKWLPIPVWDKWKHEGNDVGKLEIRSTGLPTGRLILHPTDKDHSPYLLVLSHDKPTFKLVGWIFGIEAKSSRFWCKHVPRPCYMIKQDLLRDMDSLIEKFVPKEKI